MDKMMRWNIFLKTCANLGDDDEEGPISHPFKQYNRDRFPGAIIPPTALEKAAAQAQQQQSTPAASSSAFYPAPQSVGSLVMIANPTAASSSGNAPADTASLQYYAMQQQQLIQQQQIQQQQSMANPHALQPQYNQPTSQVPGMYYQGVDQTAPSAQQMYALHQMQMSYPGQQLGQSLPGHLNMNPGNPYSQLLHQQQQQQQQLQQPPYQYQPYDPSMMQGLPTAMPYSLPTAIAQSEPPQPDPNRPTYAQNAIGVEVAKRERMAALLASRLQ